MTGCAQYWSVVSPELSPRLPALYALLKPHKGSPSPIFLGDDPPATKYVETPPDSPDWSAFWDTLDFIRLQFERPVTTSFRATFEKLLPIRERLALPGVAARVRITGGDATLDRIGALDWKAKHYMLEGVTEVLAAMREHLQVGVEEEIIALNELLCFLLLAVARKAEWKGEL